MRSGTSFGRSVSVYWGELCSLGRLNVAMLKAEAGSALRGVVMVAVLGALTFACVTMLTVFLSLSLFFWLLTFEFTPLAAALIVSGFFLLLTIGLGLMAMSRAKRIEAFPRRTAEQMKQDWQALKASITGTSHAG